MDKSERDLDKELNSSVYDAPAVKLHEIFKALKRAGFTKAQAENLIAELANDEFGGVPSA